MRIKLTVEYDGTPFKGWQRQKDFPNTVQGKIENVLRDITGEEIETLVAGRTDAGVHALGQVCHFDVQKETIRLEAFKDGLNSLTPFTISILKAEVVEDDFHARFSAQAREYEFRIFRRREHSAIALNHAVHISWPLDVQKIKRAAKDLIGEHDFAGFKSTECQSNVTMCRMEFIRIIEEGDILRIQIKANHFLHNMVRIICGTLVDIGRGKLPEGHMKKILKTKERTDAGITLAPQGLYFVKAHYLEHKILDSR